MKSNEITMFITQKQLSDRWQVCDWTIWNWCRRKKMPEVFVLPSGRRRWLLSDIEEYEKKNLRSASEFDPVLCERVVSKRNKKKCGEINQRRSGRPTKAEQVETRKNNE